MSEVLTGRITNGLAVAGLLAAAAVMNADPPRTRPADNLGTECLFATNPVSADSRRARRTLGSGKLPPDLETWIRAALSRNRFL